MGEKEQVTARAIFVQGSLRGEAGAGASFLVGGYMRRGGRGGWPNPPCLDEYR